MANEYYKNLSRLLTQQNEYRRLPMAVRKETQMHSFLAQQVERKRKKAEEEQHNFMKPRTNSFFSKPCKRKKTEEPWMNLPKSFTQGLVFDTAKFIPTPKQRTDPTQWKRYQNTQGLKFTSGKDTQNLISSKPKQQPSNLNNKRESKAATWNDKYLAFANPQSYFTRPLQPELVSLNDEAETTAITMMTVNSRTFNPKQSSTPFEERKLITLDPDEIFPNVQPRESWLPTTPSLENKIEKALKLADVVADKILNLELLADFPDPLDEIRGRILDIHDNRRGDTRDIKATMISYAVQMLAEGKPFGGKSIERFELLEPMEPRTPRPSQKLPVPTFYDNKQDLVPSPSSTVKLLSMDTEPLNSFENGDWIVRWLAGKPRETVDEVDNAGSLLVSPTTNIDQDFLAFSETSEILSQATTNIFKTPEKKKTQQQSRLFQAGAETINLFASPVATKNRDQISFMDTSECFTFTEDNWKLDNYKYQQTQTTTFDIFQDDFDIFDSPEKLDSPRPEDKNNFFGFPICDNFKKITQRSQFDAPKFDPLFMSPITSTSRDNFDVSFVSSNFTKLF